jgi:hypothetical protein
MQWRRQQQRVFAVVFTHTVFLLNAEQHQTLVLL